MSLKIDCYMVEDEQEALSLMFYHLRMAALFFEATPLAWEIPQDEFSLPAMAAWAEKMETLYPDEGDN